MPAIGRLSRDPDPPGIRKSEDPEVAERQAARQETQLGVYICAAPPGKPLLGVATERRLTPDVDELLKRDGPAHGGAARAQREDRGGGLACREVGRCLRRDGPERADGVPDSGIPLAEYAHMHAAGRCHCVVARVELEPRARPDLPEVTHAVIRTGSGEDRAPRSEEHTSELQSRLHLVCRLLLEKK